MKCSVSAPGRICLFGEHQDYLGFPVVASAIDLRATIESSTRTDRLVHLHLADLDQQFTYDLDCLPEPKPREYWLIGLHLAKREGWLPEWGWNAHVASEIPMRAGASSSSALLVAWCALMAERSGMSWQKEWVARSAWRAEVEWFDEPGGMMDQTVCALGGTQSIAFNPEFETTLLSEPPGCWVLFDSHQAKDTLGVLARAKDRRLELLQEWEDQGQSNWNLRPPFFPSHWNAEDQRLMMTTLENRRISAEGTKELAQKDPDLEGIGKLLLAHHHWLSKGIEVSTPRIDGILASAHAAGALGGKINGSGGGGTGFVLCHSKHLAAVIAAISNGQGQAIPIALGAEGVRLEHPKN